MAGLRKRLTFFGSLGACALLLLVLLAIKSSILLLSRIYPAPPLPPLTAAQLGDPALLGRGAHLVNQVLGCPQCHGSELTGDISMEADAIGRLRSADLVGIARPAADLQRVLRYGLDAGQRALWLMPSAATSQLSDADRDAVVAYLVQRSAGGKAPPADDAERAANKELTTTGRLQLLLRRIHLHEAAAAQAAPTPPSTVEALPNAAYGHYLAAVARCATCHAAGAATPQPGTPMQMQLYGQVGGAIPAYSLHDFAAALQHAPERPELRWHATAGLSRLEVEALWRALVRDS